MTKLVFNDVIRFCRSANHEQRELIYEALKTAARRQAIEAADNVLPGNYVKFSGRRGATLFGKVTGVNTTTVSVEVVRCFPNFWRGRGYDAGSRWRVSASALSVVTKTEALRKSA